MAPGLCHNDGVRVGAAILLVLVAGGCAASRPEGPAPATRPSFGTVSAAALVFDPPLAVLAVQPDLSRAGREPSAYAGYDSITTTYFYMRVRDYQTDYPYGGSLQTNRYQRETHILRVGVNER